MFMLSQCIYPFSESICILKHYCLWKLISSSYVLLVLVCFDWGDTIVCNFPSIYISFLYVKYDILFIDINKISNMIHKLNLI